MKESAKLVGRCLVVLLAGWMSLPHAQSPAPLPFPNVQVYVGGTIFAFARQPDGGLLIGGEFDAINGVPRSGLARLSPDGTVDKTFNTGVTTGEKIYSLALDSSGAIYVGGNFLRIAGVDRRNLAKLAQSGAVDSAWNPAPDAAVFEVAIDINDAVFIRGPFAGVAGENRRRLAKLSNAGTGAADPAWDPGNPFAISDFVLDGQGAIYVAGNFTSIAGQPRSHLARLSTTSAAIVDMTWNPAPNLPVSTLTLDGIGNLYAAGQFTSIGGQTVSTLTRLAVTGSGAADPVWRPQPGSVPTSMVSDRGGGLYLVGREFSFGSQPRLGIARISTNGTGTLDSSFQAVLDGNATSLLIQPDGSVLVGGSFDTANGKAALGAAAYSANGLVLDRAINAGVARGYPHSIVKQGNGGMIVAGDFAMVDDQMRNGLFRLHADGSLDNQWNPSSSLSVFAIAVDEESVYVGGSFDRIGGSARAYVAKVSGGGTGFADPSWNPGADGPVHVLFVDAGHVFAGGEFAAVGGQLRSGLAKLSTGSGTVDPAWQPSADGEVWRMTGDHKGALFVTGAFQNVSALARRYAAKISTGGAGVVDPEWNPDLNNLATQLSLDGLGNVYIAGAFDSVAGQPRKGLAKLRATGTGLLDSNWGPSFDPGTHQTYSVLPIGQDVYVSGSFQSLGGQPLHNLARLSARTGLVDPAWNPSPESYMELAAGDAGSLHVGGGLLSIGGVARSGLAALPGADVIMVGDFEFAP